MARIDDAPPTTWRQLTIPPPCDRLLGMAIMEKTVCIDNDLMRRASRKLRRYGRTVDDVVTYALTYVVRHRGDPFNPPDETPGPLLLQSFAEADAMSAGKIPKASFKSVEDLFADCLA